VEALVAVMHRHDDLVRRASYYTFIKEMRREEDYRAMMRDVDE
jgi:hypothetical protein